MPINIDMGLFHFGRKLESAKEYSLSEIPIFSPLTPMEQRMIEKKARLVEYKRGDLVYEEATPAEAFYVVISGRFRLFTKSRNSLSGNTLIYFYRGDHFGETSLLTGRPHSGSVEAKRDGLILKLDKPDFLKFVKELPALSLHLSRSMGHRLARNMDDTGHREVKISALYSKSESPKVFEFWLDLASSLRRETKRNIILVDFVAEIHPLFGEEFKQTSPLSLEFSNLPISWDSEIKSRLVQHPDGFAYLHVLVNEAEDRDEKKIANLLTFLAYRYHYLILRLPRELNSMTFKALKHCDMIYVCAEPGLSHLSACAETLTEFQQGFGFSRNEVRVILTEDEPSSPVSFEEKENILGLQIFSVLPSRTEQQERYFGTIRYLAKELAGTLVGLVLGSGAAYGLAHIGVLRILEKEGIPIDVIAGSSIGALVGCLWAGGYPSDELELLARSIDRKTGFFKLLGFRDFTIAHRGFFKGNQVSRFIESYLGDKTFQDLKIPVKVIAANLFTSEEVVLETGRVVDAIRASISIPGIFRPVFHQGKSLIDGGVIDPLPVRVLAKMGVKKIIAVNVLAGPKDLIERNRIREEARRKWIESRTQKNLWDQMLTQSLNKLNDRYAVNIFNVIMNTIQYMEYEIADSWSSQADVLIHPIVQEGHWAEFYSPDKFIRAGEEKTREQLAEIKRLIAE